MTSRVLAIALAVSVLGCASTHPGMKGKALQNALPVVVSAETVGEADGAFQMVEVTIENKSDDWVRISEAKVLIPPTENKLSVVVGNDLKDWATAMEAQAKSQRHNQDVMTLGLIAGGFLASLSNNQVVKLAGSTAMLGGLGASTANDFSRAKNYATRVELVPDTHLLHPFAIPPTLPMKRWVLFNKNSGTYLQRLAFSVVTIDGKTDIYEVELAP